MGSYVGYYEGKYVNAFVLAQHKEVLTLYIISQGEPYDRPITTTVRSFESWCEENHMYRKDSVPVPERTDDGGEVVTWQKGQKKELADRVGISKQYLCNIIGRRQRASFDLALKIERALRVMGIRSNMIDWVSSIETDSPLFAPKDGGDRVNRFRSSSRNGSRRVRDGE